MSSYEANRKLVYKIYEISLNDKTYNCHHIVTRSDRKNGLVPPDFDINSPSNLFPMKIGEHNALHRKINLIEGTKKKEVIKILEDNIIYYDEIIRRGSRQAKEIKKSRLRNDQLEIISRIELQQYKSGMTGS